MCAGDGVGDGMDGNGTYEVHSVTRHCDGVRLRMGSRVGWNACCQCDQGGACSYWVLCVNLLDVHVAETERKEPERGFGNG